jgi:uncharacterized protein involved in exopolysaccharide biosynthesis
MPPALGDLGPEEATFVDYAFGVVRRGRLIALNVFLVAVVAAVASLFLPHWYRAEGTFLPAGEERATFDFNAILREVAMPGLSDAVQSGNLSVALLQSRRVRDSLVAEFDLVKHYQVKDVPGAVEALKEHSAFFVGQEGMVNVSIEDRDPRMAARLVNRSIEILDHFNAEQRMTKGQRTRIFVERELEQSARELRAAEEALESYQAETKLVPMSTQAHSEVSASAALLARKMEVEIELGIKQNVLREGNEELKLLRSELAQIDRKLGQLPALGLEYARLLRDLKVREQVDGYLRTEYEQAKIQEERDTPSITVVDQAEPPLKRARPRRTFIVAGAAAVALVVSVLGALAATWVELLPPDDHRRSTLRAVGRELGGMLRLRRRSAT